MRIAYVCSDRGIPIDGSKGASIHVRGIAGALARRGHDVRIVTARAGEARQASAPPTIDFGFDRVLKDLRHDLAGAGHGAIGHEAYSLLLNSALGQALDRLDAEWQVDAVYERYSLWSLAALQFARARNLPLILEVNAPLVKEQQTWRTLSLRPVAEGIERLLLNEADAISVPASSLRDHIRQIAGRRRGVHVIPNGVDLAMFSDPQPAPPAIRERLRDRFVVAFLGSLKPWHGIEPLWRAFVKLRRRVPAAHLLVIGDGPMKTFLEDASAGQHADAVTLVGAVSHEAVPGLLALADVGVAPYPALNEFYFCPLKVIEYMAAGLAVVASAIGDINDLVSDGRTGVLVPPGDHKALAQALAGLHEDAARRCKLGARARQKAEARHGWDLSVLRVEQLIMTAASRRLRSATATESAA